MDVIVVVCLNTGRADTTAPAHLLVNLRANIISSPDARLQEHCEATVENAFSPCLAMVFTSQAFIHNRNRGATAC
jgi:hypothetical protein